MKTITIPAVIIPCRITDVFETWGAPKANTVYFFYKKAFNEFHGPFCLHPYYEMEGLKVQFGQGMLYRISTKEPGYQFEMQLRQAHLDDLRDGIYLRHNYTYYLLEDPETVTGPFFLSPETDKELLARQLNERIIYVVADKQSFTPFGDVQHSA